MGYLDGFMAAVPTAKRTEYLEHIEAGAELFKSHGALQVVECWGEDVPDGELTSMPMAVHCQADETVVLGWIVWPTKAVRDRFWETYRDDPQFAAMPPPPFDGKRLIHGGFEIILQT